MLGCHRMVAVALYMAGAKRTPWPCFVRAFREIAGCNRQVSPPTRKEFTLPERALVERTRARANLMSSTGCDLAVCKFNVT